MIPSNVEATLSAFCQRTPFKRFLIELVSGDRITISHPEAIAARGTFLVYHSPKRRYRVFDSTTVSQILDIPNE